jgi:hypothetical protein
MLTTINKYACRKRERERGDYFNWRLRTCGPQRRRSGEERVVRRAHYVAYNPSGFIGMHTTIAQLCE